MGLGSLTERAAVLQAIAENDALGQEKFLEKYGFGTATGYWLVYKGHSYDSKAIAGVAHGYQHPERGPLKADAFSGGEDTVARKLKKLGFTVVQHRVHPRKYWAFCAKPSVYRVADAVNHLTIDYWGVSGSDVRPGDMVLVWQTRDSKARRGVVAFGRVVGRAEVRSDASNPFWVDPEQGKTALRRVKVEYIVTPKMPLWSNEHTALQELSVYHSKGGTVFKVTDEQWASVVQAAGASDRPALMPGDVEPATELSIDRFTPIPGVPVLKKDVGTSQHTDGVRIDQSHHDIFNPPGSDDYSERGTARTILVLFNNRIFQAEYRYEGQTDESVNLQSIRFRKDLKKEFKRVFPAAVGVFTIAMGQDANHFLFTYDADAAEVPDEDENGYPEGKLAYRQHSVRERSPSVVKKAKKRFKKQHDGRLFCEVCSFDFPAVYGDRGEDFIEGHHKIPVSEMKDGDKTSPDDIAMLCSNCHRMIHRRPNITVAQLAGQVEGGETG